MNLSFLSTNGDTASLSSVIVTSLSHNIALYSLIKGKKEKEKEN